MIHREEARASAVCKHPARLARRVAPLAVAAGVGAAVALTVASHVPQPLPEGFPVAEAAPDEADAPGLPGEGLPACEWSLALSDDEREDLAEIRSDILSGEAFCASFDASQWPDLPQPVASADDVLFLARCAYGDDPALSTVTCGQSVRAEVTPAGDRYRLVATEGQPDPRKVGRTREAAASVAGDVRRDVDDVLRTGLSPSPRIAFGMGDDLLFATCAELRLARGCSYSDGVLDSAHSNDAYGALAEGESKCYGMACALKAVLDLQGVPSLVVSGDLSGPGNRHAVACVWADGRWRVADMTEIDGKSVPERLGWRTVTMPAAFGSGVGSQLIHDLSLGWGRVVAPFDEWSERRGFVPDERCVELMDAYERLVGGTGESDA